MDILWSERAKSDLTRLYDFMAEVNPAVAARVVNGLVAAPKRLTLNPRLGQQLFQFEPREVRRIVIGRYEIRYEISDKTLYVLRIWHTREARHDP